MAFNTQTVLAAAVCLLAFACAGVESASYGVRDPSVIKRILAQHNSARFKMGSGRLQWSVTLARSAQGWTNRCKFSHDINTLRSKGYGENLTLGTNRWQKAIQLWLDEKSNYNYKAATYQSNAGHFTQVVWKATKKVGCSVTHCGMGNLWSCRYFPAGNYLGQFSKNVG